jgi:hypothetical protein
MRPGSHASCAIDVTPSDGLLPWLLAIACSGDSIALRLLGLAGTEGWQDWQDKGGSWALRYSCPSSKTVLLGPPNRTSAFTTLCLEREDERIRGTNCLVGRVAVNRLRDPTSTQRTRPPTPQSQNSAHVRLMVCPRRLSPPGPSSTTRAVSVRGAISRLPHASPTRPPSRDGRGRGEGQGVTGSGLGESGVAQGLRIEVQALLLR